MPLPPLAAYVHLPWCVRKCPYCDFNSHPQREDSDFAAYTDALLADLDWAAARMPARPLRSVFFGGGTPSLCPPEQVGRILAALGARFGWQRGAEITLEANPGTVDEAHFRGFVAAGVNRLSIGVQSFDDAMLRRLGRIHDGARAHRAIRAARAAGFANLNIDLMHSLPEQCPQGALADIAQALEHAPEHLSWYELTLEPQTAFARNPPTLPDEATLLRIESRGAAALRRAGYRAYEVSAWARPGRRAQHNLNYWRYGDFLGLGAGAHSKLSSPDGRIWRQARQRAPARYLATAGSPAVLSRNQALEPQDLLEEYTLNALRLHEGFTLAQFAQRTGLPASTLQPALARNLSRGLLRLAGAHLRPTALGRRHLNALLADFAAGGPG